MTFVKIILIYLLLEGKIVYNSFEFKYIYIILYTRHNNSKVLSALGKSLYLYKILPNVTSYPFEVGAITNPASRIPILNLR